jgi:type I restriction enzyme, S subunit
MRKEKVDRSKVNFSELQPLSIHFDGSVSKREVAPGREYTMELWFARPGDIVVAKIDLKNGAVGIVPDGWQNVAVTGHFAVYEPDRAKLLPEFFHRLIQTSFFKANLWRNKVGAEGRKEVKLDFFESALIPLPPLAEQRAIVERWRSAQAQIAAADGRIERIADSAKLDFLKALGIKTEAKGQRPKCFAIGLGELDRWSVEYLTRKLLGIAEAQTGKYPAKTLRELCAGISGCTPSTKEPGFWNGNIPWVSPKDMKAEIVTDTIDHLTAAAIAEGGVSTVSARSVLVVMRSGILQRTVPIALLAREAAINQDMRAFHVKDETVVLPEFLTIHLQHRVEDLLKLVKWSTTVQSMNADELANFPISLPPLEVQRKLVERVTAARAEIARERAAAAELRQTIAAEVESLILGTKTLLKT